MSIKNPSARLEKSEKGNAHNLNKLMNNALWEMLFFMLIS